MLPPRNGKDPAQLREKIDRAVVSNKGDFAFLPCRDHLTVCGQVAGYHSCVKGGYCWHLTDRSQRHAKHPIILLH